MFAVAFPIAPLLAFINNYFLESDIILHKLAASKRAISTYRIDGGAWYFCLEFINFSAVATNCFLVYSVPSRIIGITPKILKPFVESDNGL